MHQETVAGLVKLRKNKIVSLSNALNNTSNIVDKNLREKIAQLQSNGVDRNKIVKYFKDNNYQLNGIDISKPEIYYWETDAEGKGINAAARVSLDISFNESKIETITDTGIQKILFNHIKNYKGKKMTKTKILPPKHWPLLPKELKK